MNLRIVWEGDGRCRIEDGTTGEVFETITLPDPASLLSLEERERMLRDTLRRYEEHISADMERRLLEGDP